MKLHTCANTNKSENRNANTGDSFFKNLISPENIVVILSTLL